MVFVLKNVFCAWGVLRPDLPNYTPKEYKCMCSTVVKDRYGNHTKSSNNERYKTDTELSKEVWSVEDNNATPKNIMGHIRMVPTL